MTDTISLGTYLFERLHQNPIGLKSIFGVPGDFNLTLLDKIDDVEDLCWRGCTNELNAAYAADGYSRVRGNSTSEGLGFGALITTFGVGELSAINGVAGAYAEHVGLLHIVGVPSLDAQRKQLLLHHTLGNGDFSAFHKMSAHITITTGVINDPNLAADTIDRVIREAYICQQPAYLAFPVDMVDVQVPKERLAKSLDLSAPKNNERTQGEVIEVIIEKIKAANDPVVIIDVCCARHNVSKEAREFLQLSNFKFATTPMAKGTKDIDEQNDMYAGVYVGSLSHPQVKEAVENSDLVLSLGALLSDFNTGAFSYSFEKMNVIEFHSDYITVNGATYMQIRMKELLGQLIQSVPLKQLLKTRQSCQIVKKPLREADNVEGKITHKWLWSSLSKFLKPNDIVITETGTASFGVIETNFPNQAFGISQILWGSIGYSVGCAFGAVTAAEEMDPTRRVLLFVGDGSLQLTATEISSMVRNNKKPYIFVLNNNGYTTERLIHAPRADYNAIHPWNHQVLLSLFNAKEYETYKMSETKEMNSLFTCGKFAKNDKIRLIEIMLGEMDAPENLIKQLELSTKKSSK